MGLCGLAASGHGPLWLLELMFLLAPLVLVPLALSRIGPVGRWLPLFQLGGAIAATMSFFQAPGVVAACFASAWLAVTLALAGCGVARCRRRGLGDPAEMAIIAALVYIPVGGAWLVLSRLGATPLGFREPIVLLTAVHFHYAAFATLVLIGLAGRFLGSSRLYRGVVLGAISGTPLLAVGITLSPALEALGALTLAGSLWLFAGLSLMHLPRSMPRGARALLLVSAVSLLPSMTVALAYAWSELTERSTIALSTVARVHGTLNALGFSLLGLLGWTLAARNHHQSSL